MGLRPGRLVAAGTRVDTDAFLTAWLGVPGSLPHLTPGVWIPASTHTSAQPVTPHTLTWTHTHTHTSSPTSVHRLTPRSHTMAAILS